MNPWARSIGGGSDLRSGCRPLGAPLGLPRRPRTPLREPKDGPRRPKVGPRCTKTPQDGPKRAQDASMT